MSGLLCCRSSRQEQQSTYCLCRICQRVPFRAILKFLGGDISVRDAFKWFPLLPSQGIIEERKRPEITNESYRRPFVRWHDNISNLQQSHRQCSLCRIIFHFLQNSYHFRTKISLADKRHLWLEIPSLGGNPLLTVHVGNVEPAIRISGNYRFTTTPNSPVARVFDEHAVIEDPLHPFVLRKILSWLERCDSKHPKCTHAQALVPLPARLLDLSSLPTRQEMLRYQGDPRELFSSKAFRLVDKSKCVGRYVALSYCWGETLAYKTTMHNLQEHKTKGITYAEIPKTLQDAVFLVRYLGLQYVWIDCVCIVQDDLADWEREAAQMGRIYSLAYLTIAATRASHCGEGFLQPRHEREERQKMLYADKKGSIELHFAYDDLTTAPGSVASVTPQPLRFQRGEPLLGRVWCFQERVLASRTLHLASDQMYWECAERFEEERGVVVASEHNFHKEYALDGVAKGLRDASRVQNPDAARDAWFRLIREYTSRDMTYQSDKLPALSGVISELERQLPTDKCYAGIWRSWFMRGLLWRLQVPELDSYVTVSKPRHKVEWRAPSWSFASVEGVVLYNSSDDTTNICAQFVVCRLTPKSNLNPLGELQSGFARVTAPITKILKVGREATRKGTPCSIRLMNGSLTAAAIFFDIHRYESCQALMITPHLGLAIVPASVGRDTFLRIGLVSVNPLWDAARNIQLCKSTHPPDRFLRASVFPQPTCVTLQ